jgi:hypothetical protein
VIIPNPSEKKIVKGFLDKGGVPSQFITEAKARGMKLGVASNILKQINAKVKQDLYRIHLPAFNKTMLVGIDLIMNGSSKLIGCCATVTKTLTQCHTRLMKHRIPPRDKVG